MPPRILIFAALSGDAPRTAAGLACEQLPAGAARPLAVDPARTSPAIRRAADHLAEQLALRPVAHAMAVLAHLTALLRERADATVVLEADRPERLVDLLETADLARARLHAERPAAGSSTLAVARAAAAPDLPTLRAAAAAGDLLRARELTTCGLITGPHAAPGADLAARSMLALAGLPVLPAALAEDPADAAAQLLAATPADAADPAPLIEPDATGATVSVHLPAVPEDLRAVRSDRELALQSAGRTRRLDAPRCLGTLLPDRVGTGSDGAVVIRFVERSG